MIGALERLRIVVLGAIIRYPLGGIAWHHLQYVMGLARLGHDVVFIEDSGLGEWCCYNPLAGISSRDASYGIAFAQNTFERVGLPDRWGYYDAYAKQWRGPIADHVVKFCESADLMLDLSEVNAMRPWLERIPARVLVDTDPVFNQIHHLARPEAREHALQHNVFFSFGENLFGGRSTSPSDGFQWQPTRQPIVLDAWPVTEGREQGKFTTVMQWESYPPVQYEGVEYGLKSASFLPYLDLPNNVSAVFELALGTPDAPRTLLSGKGWQLLDPFAAAPDPWAYQDYIRGSKAEFSVAKQAYAVTNSGWFSERSAGYLASGRPVVVQQTGFSSWLHAEMGVLPFNNLDQAIDAVRDVEQNYAAHCKAAREVAAEFFDSDRVLGSLIDRALASVS